MFYEQVSYYWNGRQRAHLHFSPSIQGDVDRTFLGRDGYPYRQWLRADLMSNKSPSSPRERFDLAKVHLRTSKMAGLIVGDVLDVFHICRPEEVFKGRVVKAHQMYAIVAIETMEALAQLLEEEYRDIPPGRNSSMDFLCLRKSFPLHIKQGYTVLLELGEDDCSKLTPHINTSPLLTVGDPKDKMIAVKKEGQAYTIEDLCGDVTYKPRVKNIEHIASLLEMMAWFKFVKAVHQDPPHISPTHSCYLTSSDLLPLLSGNSNIQFSSRQTRDTSAAPIFCSGKEGSYWKPSGNDRNPQMCINLSSNCVLTAAEIKVGGDWDSESEVQVQLKYCEAVFSREHVFNDESVLSLELQAKSLVLCVSLERSMPVKEEDRLWDLQFFTTQGIPVQFGHSGSKITWSDVRNDFFLGQPTQLSKLEIRAPRGNITGKLKVTVHSSFVPLCNMVVKTPGFPKLFKLDTPVVASMVLLAPHRPDYRVECPISLQVQLYGAKDGGIVEVEEGKRVAFRFTNHSPHEVYVTVLCLEETGKIQHVFSETAINSAGSHIIRSIITSIPKEHNVLAITDTYKVFVTKKMMYLEPYIQRGLHEHFNPLHYDVCSYGTTAGDKDDLWDQYEFKVRIRRATTC